MVLDLWRGERLYLVDIWQELEDYQDVTNAPAAEQAARLIRTVRNVARSGRRAGDPGTLKRKTRLRRRFAGLDLPRRQP